MVAWRWQCGGAPVAQGWKAFRVHIDCESPGVALQEVSMVGTWRFGDVRDQHVGHDLDSRRGYLFRFPSGLRV